MHERLWRVIVGAVAVASLTACGGHGAQSDLDAGAEVGAPVSPTPSSRASAEGAAPKETAELVPPSAEPAAPVESPESPRASASSTAPHSPDAADASSERMGPDARTEESIPQRIGIEELGLDVGIIELGLADSGELEVPTDPDDVGWFSGGGRPGGPGPTVVVGHVDSTSGPAVFAELPQLQVGDEVTIATAQGEVRYAIDRTETFSQAHFPTAAVFGATAADQLRLITCTGPYDRDEGRYTENWVVFASPV